MTPTLGQVVAVRADPSRNNGAVVAPAIVTRVWNEEVVNVTVFPDAADGLDPVFIRRTSLTHVPTVDELDTDWRWTELT